MKLYEIARYLFRRQASPWAQRIGRDNERMESLLATALQANSSGIDVGAHEGAFLRLLLKYAPHGQHWAFEPLPEYVEKLREAFKGISIYNLALSDSPGKATFYKAVGAEAMSGLKPQHYPVPVQLQPIEINTARLDDIVPNHVQIDMIKIDVEGAELSVLQGAKHLLHRCRPLIIFEFAQLHAEAYSVTPNDMFTFFEDNKYSIWRLDKREVYTRQRFEENFHHSHQSNYNQLAETNFLGIPNEKC